MDDDAQATLDLVSRLSEVRRIAGVYSGLEDSRVLVDFGGGRVPAYSLVGYMPRMGESVWVEIVDDVAFMLGPTVAKSASGVVTAVSAGKATVTTEAGIISATVSTGMTVAVGNIVKLYWADGAHVLGVIGSTTTNIVPAPPRTNDSKQTRTFTAVDSGSYQAGYGWRTNEVWSSASNRGLWFYGSKIKDTIPAAAVIKSAEIYLPPPKRLLGARPFGRHTYGSKPGGAPTLAATSTLGGTAGWVPIPTSLIDALKAGIGGVGFDLGGWNIWPGTQADGQSGALRISYET